MDRKLFEAAERVKELFCRRGYSLSVAESCTGGLLSSAITDVPGASVFFRLGVVAYSAWAKENVLNVSSETLKTHGMVSEASAREMAEKVRSLADTDFAFSTTGNLGPETLEGKERGLVYMAVSGAGRTVGREFRLTGDREANKREAVLSALSLLLEAVEGG